MLERLYWLLVTILLGCFVIVIAIVLTIFARFALVFAWALLVNCGPDIFQAVVSDLWWIPIFLIVCLLMWGYANYSGGGQKSTDHVRRGRHINNLGARRDAAPRTVNPQPPSAPRASRTTTLRQWPPQRRS
jgi:hypothetical protein